MRTEKNVPELRFKGFSEAWEENPLSTFISSLDAGASVNSGDRAANEGELGILKTSCVTNGFFDPYENKVVFKAEEMNRLKEPVLENTIIISRMNTPALVGANAYIKKSLANYFLPDRLWAAKPTSKGDLKFIAYILGSDKGRLALSDLATGTSGSMKNISKPSTLRLMFWAPCDQEQTAIGNTFQKLDGLINQHQQKHDKLCNIKKAMLEKMFPKQGETIPEIRFKGFGGEWEETVLSGVIDVRSGRDYKHLGKGSIPVYGTGGYMLSVDSALSNDEDAIGIGRKGTIDKPYLLRAPFWTVDTLFYAVPKSEFNLDYLYSLFQKIDWKKYDESTGVPSLSKVAINNIPVRVTCNEEQAAIGNYFQKLDALINQHQQQITKLKNIKQACLSKMFV